MSVDYLTHQKVRGILKKAGYKIATSWGSSNIRDSAHWNGTDGIEISKSIVRHDKLLGAIGGVRVRFIGEYSIEKIKEIKDLLMSKIERLKIKRDGTDLILDASYIKEESQ